MKSVYHYYTLFNHIKFKIPTGAVLDIAQPGYNDQAVAFWENKIDLSHIKRENKIKELAEYGAWTNEELEDMEEFQLNEKLIWITAHDIKEDLDNFYQYE